MTKKATKTEKIQRQSSRRATAKTTIDSPVKLKKEKAPVEKLISPNKPVHRERRSQHSERRGRSQEKSPPGTRTKMLKIIYDHRLEIEQKRRRAFVGKVTFGVILTLSIIYGSQHVYEATVSAVKGSVEWLSLDKWWSNISTKPQIRKPSSPRYQQSQTSPRKNSRYSPTNSRKSR